MQFFLIISSLELLKIPGIRDVNIFNRQIHLSFNPTFLELFEVVLYFSLRSKEEICYSS